MSRRVVITGLGCVSPLGSRFETFWDNLAEGRSGVRPISLFDATDFPVRMAAEVKDWSLTQVGDVPPIWRKQARQTQFAIGAAAQAVEHAGLDLAGLDAAGPERVDRAAGGISPERIGVFLGCGEIFPDFTPFCLAAAKAIAENQFRPQQFLEASMQVVGAESELALDPGIASSFVASLVGAQGPTMNFTTACVSSSLAIGESAEAIRRGDADVMLAGGAHSMIHPFGVAGFHRLSTLSTRNDDPQRAARPFDLHRDGFVVGEGGVVLVLEELEHARRRGVLEHGAIWGEIRGFGCTNDAFRVTEPRPDGTTAGKCIELALRSAQLDRQDIDYINAHGSGTAVNDRVETTAIKQVFGQYASQVPVSSSKSMTGHLTTACGAIELLACLLPLQRGVIPPTINWETPDPECDLDCVPNEARQKECRHVLSNSFGFGGQNVVLVVSRV